MDGRPADRHFQGFAKWETTTVGDDDKMRVDSKWRIFGHFSEGETLVCILEKN